jgi:hypothetical protein
MTGNGCAWWTPAGGDRGQVTRVRIVCRDLSYGLEMCSSCITKTVGCLGSFVSGAHSQCVSRAVTESTLCSVPF